MAFPLQVRPDAVSPERDVETLKYNIENPQNDWCEISWKPYLRPMSSMTEKEKFTYEYLTDCSDYMIYSGAFCGDVINWLNEHHFDYRGLIEKSLAIVAPDNMYK